MLNMLIIIIIKNRMFEECCMLNMLIIIIIKNRMFEECCMLMDKNVLFI